MSTDTDTDTAETHAVCVHCLLRHVTALVGKLADAWYSDDLTDANMDVVHDSIGELCELLFEDEDVSDAGGAQKIN